MTTPLPGGITHELPEDLRKALHASPDATATWLDITPLARNEWICWVISVKTEATRGKHITRAIEELASGDRRPCCWMGCTHRNDKALSSSQKFILDKQR